jgi:hypothetical protein
MVLVVFFPPNFHVWIHLQSPFFTAMNLSCFLKVSYPGTSLLCSKVHARSTLVPSFNLKMDHNLWTLRLQSCPEYPFSFYQPTWILFLEPQFSHKAKAVTTPQIGFHLSCVWTSVSLLLVLFNNRWVGIRVGCQITGCSPPDVLSVISCLNFNILALWAINFSKI